MKYSEFKDNYRWITKNSNVSAIYAEDMDETIGTVETTRYKKAGSVWKETSRETSNFTRKNYMNAFESVPFFRNLGGYERIERNYTKFGYIPYSLTSISPDREERVIRKYRF